MDNTFVVDGRLYAVAPQEFKTKKGETRKVWAAFEADATYNEDKSVKEHRPRFGGQKIQFRTKEDLKRFFAEGLLRLEDENGKVAHARREKMLGA